MRLPCYCCCRAVRLSIDARFVSDVWFARWDHVADKNQYKWNDMMCDRESTPHAASHRTSGPLALSLAAPTSTVALDASTAVWAHRRAGAFK